MNGDSLVKMRALKFAGVAASTVLGAVSATAAYGSISRSSQIFGPSIYRGPGKRRTVALTFEDGPSEGTERILEYLDRERVWATFFQCGMNVRRLPRIAGDVAAAGHQLGNHSYSHPRMTFKSREFIEREFSTAQQVITEETGITPMVVRPPYGFRWLGMREAQQKLALLGVMWTVLGDWRLPPDKMAAHVLSGVEPGAIISLYDGRTTEPHPDISNTLEALRRIVPLLKDQGYDFEVISDLVQDNRVVRAPRLTEVRL
jgi:peptidoglycan/xylan/chitin deacetylase (PgdA/CDA1 family)